MDIPASLETDVSDLDDFEKAVYVRDLTLGSRVTVITDEIHMQEILRHRMTLCFVREVQRHPVTEDFLHVDFIRVDVSQTIRAEVPITMIGEAPAIRIGGTLLQPLLSLLVEALPMDIPASLEADVSDLDDFEKAVYVRDLTLGSRVTVITDENEMIARVTPPRVEVEEVPIGVEGEELEEGAEEGAEGEGGADEGGAGG